MVVRSVNYFGHVAVASWRSTSAAVALGAMLPDFSTMASVRVAEAGDPELAAGIDLHHATDSAFHVLPVVTGLMRELDQRLDRLGCARGPRRAVAHIGVELLLDGVLVDEPAYREAYLRGIAFDSAITWREPGDAERFAKLVDRLRSYGVPDDLKRPESIVFRMSRMLAHRPLLAPSPADLVAIGKALADHQPRVTVATDTVIRGMRAALGTV
ncbi:MAG: hypothetical protein ABI867_23910 [Kofleriaceae bacterium]